MGRRILVIDNQYYDYKLIFEKISAEGYDVYPKEDYTAVLDYVRIFLNPHYGRVRNQKALNLLMNYINSHAIELIIMDYKLSGTYDGLTGVELLLEIHALNDDVNFVFFSRTPKKLESVRKKLTSLPFSVEWIEKDEAGLKMDDPFYFKKYVIDQLIRLLGKEKLLKDIERVNMLKSMILVKKKNFDHKLQYLIDQAVKRGYFLSEDLAVVEKCFDATEPYLIVEQLKTLAIR